MKLVPKPGFDWKRLTWGRPDSPPTVLCSYCSAALPEDGAPIVASTSTGWTIRLCDKCCEKCFEFAKESDDGRPLPHQAG